MNPLIVELKAIVGDSHCLIDRELTESYTWDWTGRYHGECLAVVRPASTLEVAAIVRACARHRVPIVPQGGRTGLVNASVPPQDPGPAGPPIILSTTRLTRLDPVDQLAGQVTVGAGVTLAGLHRHAQAAGWEYGVDLAARDSCTIGGNVATNAGGIRVIAFGMTRMQVTGIEVVLSDGSIIEHLQGMPKDNTGYDLVGLMTGSEGTLGIITAVRVRLHQPVGATTVVLMGAGSFAQVQELLSSTVVAGVRVLAAEVTDRTGIELAMQVTGQVWPLDQRHPLTLLLEVEDGGTADGLRLTDDVDAVIAIDAADKARLWAYRERQADAFSAVGGIAHHQDVSIPLSRLAEWADDMVARLAAMPSLRAFGVFGHVGDGNIHVVTVGDDADEADRIVFAAVAEYGGSISAEHGVGRAKSHALHLCRTPAEIAAMRAIKMALDPHGLLNPGTLLPVSATTGVAQ